MPTYEYACKDCSEHLEVVQSFKDDALTECPSCGGNLRKVFSAAGIIFKGSGWHVKDYASASNRSGGRDGASASDGDSSGSDGAAAKDASGDAGSSPPGKDGSKDGGTKTSDTKSSGKDGASSSTSGSSSAAAAEKKSA
jgi:putative FmdB family regulatory protein